VRRRKFLGIVGALLLMTGSAPAHDPSSYGGVFRSRDLGATWLNADVGLFLSAALTVAVDPRDSSHLLAGTDVGLLRSHNGGRSWQAEAPELIFGAVFAAAFLDDGEICAAASGVFRRTAGRWAAARAPKAATPARAVVAGTSRLYLVGREALFASEDGGRSFGEVAGVAPAGGMIALALARAPREMLVGVIDGRIMTSVDGGLSWQDGGLGGPGAPVDMVTVDPQVPGRTWAASAATLMRSDDLGARLAPVWRSVGHPLPEPGTIIRGVAAHAATLVVTTDRGTYRSKDGGETWTLKEDNLPIHLEAGPLARDPADAGVIYAVYSLLPYAEVWRTANEGGNLLARLDALSIAGASAFCLLVLIGGTIAVRWLTQRRAAGAVRAPR
jgi:photosystem II stability/assembly factor-like uncharacterized protein